MLKKLTIILILSSIQTFAQNTNRLADNEVNFDRIISKIKKWKYYDKKDYKLKLPLIYKNDEFSVEISKNPINFELDSIVIKNPYDNSYPVSFSVIYKDRLITLFEKGFICIFTSNFKRDLEFEEKLNTRHFEYHWLLNEKLVGLSDGKYYSLNNENIWTEYFEIVPFSKQPKLFEDDKFVSFCDCNGEWGGNVYFFNKQTKTTHFTVSTCANSIINQNNNYYVLSHLGHGFGTTYLESIPNPNNLPIIDLKSMKKTYKWETLGNFDYTVTSETIFYFNEFQFFSFFKHNDKTLYLVNWCHQNFLAEIENSVIKIVNPLFNKEYYTDNPITTNYNNTILINFDSYSIAGEKEVYCIIIKDKKLTKIDWNDKHIR